MFVFLDGNNNDLLLSSSNKDLSTTNRSYNDYWDWDYCDADIIDPSHVLSTYLSSNFPPPTANDGDDRRDGNKTTTNIEDEQLATGKNLPLRNNNKSRIMDKSEPLPSMMVDDDDHDEDIIVNGNDDDDNIEDGRGKIGGENDGVEDNEEIGDNCKGETTT